MEPQPLAFARLAQLHRNRTEWHLCNAAIGPRNEKKKLFTIRQAPGLPDWLQQIASFDETHLIRQSKLVPERDIRPLITPIDVDCITFDELLARTGFDEVDILQIDAEGFDFELLKLFGFPRRLPSIVNFEHIHLSMADWNGAVELLVASGYRVAKAGWDTIAFRHE